MTLFDIIKLLFTKIGETESVKNVIDSITKVPKVLKHALMITVVFGGIYLGYIYIYKYQVETLKSEVIELKETLQQSVKEDEYSNNVFYLIEAIKLCSQINKCEYEERQQELDIIRAYISKRYPTDPILYDIDAMKHRSQFNYDHYNDEFDRVLNKCIMKSGK